MNALPRRNSIARPQPGWPCATGFREPLSIGAPGLEARDSLRVYSFRVYDFAAKAMRMSPYKATREAIVSCDGGEVLEGTGQDVSPDEVDAQGRYRRIATGWGDLS